MTAQTKADHEADTLLFSLRQLAAITGIHRDTIKQRLGGISPRSARNGHAVYFLGDVGSALFADAGGTPTAPPNKLGPQAANHMASAQLKKIKIDQQLGHLLPVDKVRLEWGRVLKAVMATLETLPDVLERDAGLTPEQIIAVVTTLDDVRERLYQEMIDPPEVAHG